MANPISDVKMDEKFQVEEVEIPTVASEVQSHHRLSKAQAFRAYRTAVFMSVSIAYAAVMDGYCLSMPGNIIANPGFIDQLGTVEVAGVRQLDAKIVSNWSTIAACGIFVGFWVSSFVNERFGRKVSMWIMWIAMIIGNVLQIVAKDWKVWAVSRMVVGTGQGLMQSSVTVYIAEIAPTQLRGTLLALYSFFFALGQLACSVALEVIATSSPLAFRRAFFSQFALLALFLPGLLWAPESPWYYVRNDMADKARSSLRRIYGSVPGYDLESELEAMQRIVAQGRERETDGVWINFKACFQGNNLRRTLLACIPLSYQMLVGVALFFIYTTYFFQLAGYARPFQASLIQFSILLIFLVISFYTIDKLGRRASLLIGGCLMTACSLSVGGIGFSAKLPGTALVALTCLWTAAYSLSAGAVGWVYLVEVSTPRLRAYTTGIAATVVGAFNILFSYTVPIMLSPQQANWGLKIGLFYGGLSVMGLVVIYFTVVETRGRSYADLDEMFAAKVSARHAEKFVTSSQRESQPESAGP